MSLHLQCRTTLLYVQYSTFVSKIYELAIKVNFLSTTQMSTCLPLDWRVYRMQEKSLLSFKNNNKKQEIIILFFIMCIHGGGSICKYSWNPEEATRPLGVTGWYETSSMSTGN